MPDAPDTRRDSANQRRTPGRLSRTSGEVPRTSGNLSRTPGDDSRTSGELPRMSGEGSRTPVKGRWTPCFYARKPAGLPYNHLENSWLRQKDFISPSDTAFICWQDRFQAAAGAYTRISGCDPTPTLTIEANP